MDYNKLIKSVKDFPIEGILFRDITPLLADGEAFYEVCHEMAEFCKKLGATKVAGPESRGFIFACAIAHELKIGFVPVRKPNKLPRETYKVSYDLEYGSNTLEMHQDGLTKDDVVIIVDDLLATGGTTEAVIKLCEKSGAKVVGCSFMIELEALKGRDALKGIEVQSIIKY